MVDQFSVFWFRRDLRLEDNHGLYKALKSGQPVLPVFIFDKSILDKLKNKQDRRLQFIHSSLNQIHKTLQKVGSGLRFYHGTPEDVFAHLLSKGKLVEVYTNHDYEPYARQRDERIRKLLNSNGVGFHTFKDQVVFEKEELLSGQGLPYTVFTPYSKRWKGKLIEQSLPEFPSEKEIHHLLQWESPPIPSLKEIGFSETENGFPSADISDKLIQEYGENRDFPALPATSRLSVHLRFGTVSIRKLVKRALPLSESWLNELIWREFYMQILWNFPHVGDGKSFKPAYDSIKWQNDPIEFRLWCEGKTGYPIVDAGMRELNKTGFMHNRVRMIAASFLIKHLLIDWRWGEAWFAENLLDFDLAANNGGWQWAAGSGCDAAPYFRVFNPTLQTAKFDKQWTYIKKWVPEWNLPQYLQNQIVNHEFARKRVLEVYKRALEDSGKTF
jgi:deoxyribodipyrimidine photo-lyase